MKLVYYDKSILYIFRNWQTGYHILNLGHVLFYDGFLPISIEWSILEHLSHTAS